MNSTILTTDLGGAAGSHSADSLVVLPPGSEELDIHTCRVTNPRRFAYSAELRKQLERLVPLADVVHIHCLYLYPTFIAAKISRKNGVPYVVSPRGTLDPWIRQRRRPRKLVSDVLWQRKMLVDANLIHATTAVEASLWPNWLPREKIVIAPNGIEQLAQSSPDGRRFRDKHLRGSQEALLMHLGRYAEKKGLHLLIAATGILRGNGTTLRLVMIGPDDEGLRPRLLAQAERLGIADSVNLLPAIVDPLEKADAYAAASVWALPSFTENFGNAALEALAAGCPTVLSSEVNLAPAAEQAGAAVVVHPEVTQIAAAVERILRDPLLEQSLRSAGPRFAHQYERDAVAPVYAAAYRTMVEA